MNSNKESIVEEYFEKTKQDAIKEEILRVCLTKEALDIVLNIKIAHVELYHTFRDVIVKGYMNKTINEKSITANKARFILKQLRQVGEQNRMKMWLDKYARVVA